MLFTEEKIDVIKQFSKNTFNVQEQSGQSIIICMPTNVSIH